MNPVLQTHLRTQHGPHGDAYARGFLAGLQCNPEPMVPSVWMNQLLWKDSRGSFASAPEARAIVAALAKEWENTERLLRGGNPGLMAFLWSSGEVEVLPRSFMWSSGFFDAAYLEGYDFVGSSEGDLSAIAPFEVILSAGLQRGYRTMDVAAFDALQADHLRHLFRDDLVLELVSKLDRDLVRAFLHFRGMEPIVLHWQEEL